MSFPRSPRDSKRGSPATRPRRRLYVPAAIVALLLVTVLVASAAAPPEIDNFSRSPTLALDGTLGVPATDTYAEPSPGTDIIGGEREAWVQRSSGTDTYVVTFFGTYMSISTGANTNGTTILTYDGIGGTKISTAAGGEPVVPNGLCSGGCPDLTKQTVAGDTNAFSFRVLADDVVAPLTVTVWDGRDATGATYCRGTSSVTFPGGFAAGPVRVRAFEYPLCTGGPADIFQHVGAIRFQITGEALDMQIDNAYIALYDWGDLPQNASCSYATTLACEGPRHLADTNLHLGTLIDPAAGIAGEVDGQPTVGANGDDTHGLDDEDGVVVVYPWQNGASGGSLQITRSGAGHLVGWIDWAGDGFTHLDAVIDQDVTAGTSTFVFNVPAGTFNGTSSKSLYARFRLFPANEINPGLWIYAYDGRNSEGAFNSPLIPPGQSAGGEVEDYQWPFGPTAVNLSGLSASATTSPLTAVLMVIPMVAIIGGGVAFARRRRS